MTIKRVVTKQKEHSGIPEDLEALELYSPIGSTVVQQGQDSQANIFIVTYGPVKPRLRELPNILKSLKAKFGGRLLDMSPTPTGLKVRIAKFGVVK